MLYISEQVIAETAPAFCNSSFIWFLFDLFGHIERNFIPALSTLLRISRQLFSSHAEPGLSCGRLDKYLLISLLHFGYQWFKWLQSIEKTRNSNAANKSWFLINVPLSHIQLSLICISRILHNSEYRLSLKTSKFTTTNLEKGIN